MSNTRLHYDQVARLGCILCRIKGHFDTPCEIHHIRKYGGKRENAPVIGLCPEHHRGNTGVHGMGKKAFAKHHGFDELDLLDITKELLRDQEGTWPAIRSANVNPPVY